MFNEEQYLILSEKKQDITSSIYKTDEQYIYVKFKNNNKIFKYNKKKIFCYIDPITLDHTQIIKTKDRILTNITKILKFDNYIKVFFKNNTTKLYQDFEINIEENLLSEENNRKVFNYLKELAGHLNLSDIEKENEYNEYNHYDKKNDGFLSNIYNKIEGIKKGSILKEYLGIKSKKRKLKMKRYIYPFSFNLSQEQAIKNAFSYPVSVIEGPPGTGKTQTILNIIANAILNKKTVAVVSNNNTATKNVYEKLQKNGVEGIAVQLGKNDNITDFIIKQDNYQNCFSPNWILSETEERKKYERLKNLKLFSNNYLKKKNKISTNKVLLDNLKLEQKYFIHYLTKEEHYNLENRYIKIPSFKADKLKSLMLFLNKFENKNNHFSPIIQWLTEIRFGFRTKQLFKYEIEEIMKSLEYNYYDRKITELEKEIILLNKIISGFNLENYFKEYTNISMELFKSYIAKKYPLKNKYNEHSIKNTKTLTQDYPVILSTTYSLINCTNSNFLYDYVIVDESSQVDLVSAFPALMFAKNVVVVGDSKQLPNIVDSNRMDEFETIFQKYNISSKYNYTKNSLLDLTKNLSDNIPTVILKEHYRCHPKIIGFCNKMYYNNELIIHTDSTDENPIKQIKCPPGNYARLVNKSYINDRQFQIIKKELIPNEKIDIQNDSVGIITPYKEQKKYLKRKLNIPSLEIDTVHGFQGNEKNIIIFSTVANNITKFLDNPNSLNVAISRAIKKLYLVTPYKYKSKKYMNLLSFIDYINYQNFEVVESNLCSIFDLLYKVNKNKLEEFLSNYKSKFSIKYASEKLMNFVIDEVLNMKEYENYELYQHEYPLRLIFKNRSILTTREQKYISNNAHVDFMIINKHSHSIALGIEVDSLKYHGKKEQEERDKLKNNIFKKNGVPLLRVRTDECIEKEELIKILDKIKSKDMEN